MRIRIRYLGSLSLLVGKDEEVLDIESEKVTIKDLLIELVKRYEKLIRAIDPRGRIKPGYLLFINEIDYLILGLDHMLKDGDEAIIMPISHGGEEVIFDIINRFNKIYEKCDVKYYHIRSWSNDLWNILNKIYSGKKVFYQVFKSDRVPSKRILLISLAKALEAMRRSENVSRDINIEILLKLVNSRDIKTSIKKLGVEVGEESILTLIYCNNHVLDTPDKIISEITEIKPSNEQFKDWLINLSVTLGANTSVCERIDDVNRIINCLEICLMNKISVQEHR